jgi:hypothetical protein
VRTSILWSGFALFLGIGRTRCMRRLLDGLHGSNAVRPNGQVEHEDSLTSLQESTPRFFAARDEDSFRRHGALCSAAVDQQDNLGRLGANTSFEIRSWRRLK